MWSMITFWWSQLVEYQIKPGERRMDSVQGKRRREQRFSIPRGKLLKVKPKVDLTLCNPILNCSTEKRFRFLRQPTEDSLVLNDRWFDFSDDKQHFCFVICIKLRCAFAAGILCNLHRSIYEWFFSWGTGCKVKMCHSWVTVLRGHSSYRGFLIANKRNSYFRAADMEWLCCPQGLSDNRTKKQQVMTVASEAGGCDKSITYQIKTSGCCW